MNLIKKYKKTLTEVLGQVQAKKGMCDWDSFEAALRYCEVTLQSRQYDFIRLVNYKLSRKLDFSDFGQLFGELVKYE